jgi:hypothetical protein
MATGIGGKRLLMLTTDNVLLPVFFQIIVVIEGILLTVKCFNSEQISRISSDGCILIRNRSAVY